MNALPPLRDLPRHAARRDQLIAAISRPRYAGDRSRWLIPAGVAAAVAVVASGVVLVGTMAGQGESPVDPGISSPMVPSESPTPSPPTSSPTASPTSSSSPSPVSMLAPPPSHHMSQAEMTQAFEECTDGAADEWRPVFEPVTGRVFELDETAAHDVVRRWVVARSHTDDNDLLVCVFHGWGLAQGHRFGSPIAKELQYMRTPVQGEVAGFGRYVDPVATVTVSTTLDGPEVRAVLDHGYWFIPVPAISPEHVVRGYDENGELVYDSRELYDGCYADPSGERVVDRNTAPPDVDPADCRRTYDWP